MLSSLHSDTCPSPHRALQPVKSRLCRRKPNSLRSKTNRALTFHFSAPLPFAHVNFRTDLPLVVYNLLIFDLRRCFPRRNATQVPHNRSQNYRGGSHHCWTKTCCKCDKGYTGTTSILQWFYLQLGMVNTLLVRVTRDSLGFVWVSVLPCNVYTVQTISGYEINKASAVDTLRNNAHFRELADKTAKQQCQIAMLQNRLHYMENINALLWTNQHNLLNPSKPHAPSTSTNSVQGPLHVNEEGNAHPIPLPRANLTEL